MNSCRLILGNEVLEASNECKLLGVILDSSLCFKPHVLHLEKKCNFRIFLLRRLKQHGVRVDSLRLFYLSSIRSVLVYAVQSWYMCTNKDTRDILERIQCIATRVILPNVDSYTERLAILQLPVFNDLCFDICKDHFC